MKVIILGSTGMIGKSLLIECLADDSVTQVLLINRTSLKIGSSKVQEIIHPDFSDLSQYREQMKSYDACFFCLGVSSVGMTEEKYRKITYDLTLNFAKTLVSVNPHLVFCYVSGAGTDGSEKGRVMWARIKGRTENELLALPFKNSFMFRPGYIQPLKGVKAKSGIVNFLYLVFTPLYFVLRPLKGFVTDSVSLARAMLNVVRKGYHKRVIDVRDINALAR